MSNQTPTGKPPKSMSSRLLTMKFMQRAAASSPVSSPATPDSVSSKRRKAGETSPSVDISALADQKAVRIAMEQEEYKRRVALEKQALEAGETRWVLNFEQSEAVQTPKTPLRVVQTGFAGIDHERPHQVIDFHDEDEEHAPGKSASGGRRSFGRFNRVIEKMQDPDAESSSDSDPEEEADATDSESDSDDEGTDINDLVKEQRREAARKFKEDRQKKRKAEKAELLKLAEKRKKKDVNINTLKSISGGSYLGGQTSQACHNCGKVGHLQAQCPKRTRERDDHDDPRRRKSRKST